MSSFAINSNNTATNKRKLDVITGVHQTIDQLNALSVQILELCKSKHNLNPSLMVSNHINTMLTNFLSETPDDFDRASEYLELFISSSVPKALVMLYKTQDYTTIAVTCIREFIHSLKSESLKPIHTFIVLKFCKILGEDVGTDDKLYDFCRSRLGTMIESTGIAKYKDDTKKLVSLNDVFPFVHEISMKLYGNLEPTKGTTDQYRGLSILVHDFTAFMLPVRNVLRLQAPLMNNDTDETVYYDKEIVRALYCIFYTLLGKMKFCLRLLGSKEKAS